MRSDDKQNIPEDFDRDMYMKIDRILRMMRFLGVHKYQISKFGVDWCGPLLKYGEDIQVCFSSITNRISVMRRLSASKSDYIYLKPFPEIIDRCYYSLVGDAWEKIVKATNLSSVPFIEEAHIKFYGLSFLNAYDYYGRAQY